VASNPRIDDLRKRLEKEPGSRLFAQLAEELRKDGDLEEAISVSREGLKKQPAYPSARMTLGRALFDTGDMAAAREELQTVLNGAPDNILASRLLAECLEALGDFDAALGRYRATLALSPGDKHILARVRDLEGKRQAVAHPAAAVAGTTAMRPEAPIPLVTVDEPMELETSQERPAPRPEAAPIPLVETSAEFELESAYDAPGTQWRTGPPPAAAPTSGAPVVDAPPVVPDSTIGERTLVDEPAPTIDIKRAAPPPVREPAPTVAAPAAPEAEPSFEYAFDTPAEAPAPPAHAPPTPTPRAAAMPPLPEPVAVAAAAVTALETPEPVAAPELFTPEPAMAPVPPSPRPPVVPSVPPPAPAAREPPAPAPVPSAIEGELASPTLAELYLNQGFPEKAIEVYRRLLDLEPANARARARLAELQELVAGPAAPPLAARGAGAAPTFAGEPSGSRDADEARAARRQALERTIARLESLRAALQKGPR